nr:hypothetical protein GCM10010200_035300 [Actinomadura rugatobispora]
MVIRAYIHGELNEVVWEATFTSHLPAEFTAAFLVGLAAKPHSPPNATNRHHPHSPTSEPPTAARSPGPPTHPARCPV